MDHIPSEIWAEICSLACVDNGRTGRALSLVSRFINEISKPYKLQSISVMGERQLCEFADLIEQTPTHLRRVNCIFVSPHTHYDVQNDQVLHRQGSPWRLLRVYSALERILCAISSTVRIVHAYFVYAPPFVLLPISLPVLEELVLHGPIDHSIDAYHPIQFKALKHLNLTWAHLPSSLLRKLLGMTPSLTDLRIVSSLFLCQEIKPLQFPTHLEHISIHSPIEPKPRTGESIDISTIDMDMIEYYQTMPALLVLTDRDHRVALLPPLQLDWNKNFPLLDAEANWNVSAACGSQDGMQPTSSG